MPSILKHTPSAKIPVKPFQVSRDKTTKVFTPNYFLLSQHLTKDQDRILKYLIVKLNSTGHINVSTSLINDYKKVLNLSKQSALDNVKPRFKASYSRVVEDIIFLIDSCVLIRIKPNSAHFILNPCYGYPRSAINKKTVPVYFANEWVIKEQITEEYAHNFAMRYYFEMCEIKANWQNYGREKKTKKARNRVEPMLLKYIKSTLKVKSCH